MSRTGELTDEIPGAHYLQLIHEIFQNSNIEITICYGRISIPSEDQRMSIIVEAHNSSYGGHKGMTKTYRRVRERFYWENMQNQIQEFVRKCKICQERKVVRARILEPMVLTDLPLEKFYKVSIDTVGPLPLTPSGNKYLLTIQCNFTKYCVAVAIPDISAITIADAFARHFIAIYGAPRYILSDRGSMFLSKMFQQLMKIFKVDHITTSGYHPQTNGSLERTHIVLVDYIVTYAKTKEDWDLVIPFSMLSYNTSYHEGLKCTPFELIYGNVARLPSAFPSEEKLETYGDYLQDLVKRLTEIQNFAAQNLIEAKLKSKEYYDKKAKPHNFKIGDLVLVLKEPRKGKFDNRYISTPFKIIEILDKNNFVLESENGKRTLKHCDKVKRFYA